MLVRKRAVPILVLLVLLAGCAHQTNTTTPPTPPQVTLAASVNALAQSLDAAVASMIEAKNQGKMSQSDLNAANNVAAIIATSGKKVNAELRSVDTWSVQKVKIIGIVSTVGVNQAIKALNSTAASLLTTAIAIWNQIATTVGGPTL